MYSYSYTSLYFTIVCTTNRVLIVVGGYKNKFFASPTCLPRIRLCTQIPASLFYSWQHGFR
ncbi:hypothetical protein CPAR01_01368 [Colletotrichum paranaense]|uniref:Uncharacterized protein n=3 Tax=Colletotrichum acutatum species complex TaxID=2707335 RepID=A0AAJ0E0Y5_9PEZI|nr:uncharacterized protein CCOS01_06717 [Colletotrichum costaricense]XP_060356514.1 uncharacterized protein CPAR01_01368 [Colletotrichum paranaense]KAI3532773.1 hypothetical protein CSPX01_13233 [Colletotrichum filicis]KAK1528883.1 hypothetical protein CCOS01_06717 [Colletotrichum costaricense]KAK1547401.1 hypothetical protein CPAR01_01368 [Colletotrichum paranaense]